MALPALSRTDALVGPALAAQWPVPGLRLSPAGPCGSLGLEGEPKFPRGHSADQFLFLGTRAGSDASQLCALRQDAQPLSCIWPISQVTSVTPPLLGTSED